VRPRAPRPQLRRDSLGRYGEGSFVVVSCDLRQVRWWRPARVAVLVAVCALLSAGPADAQVIPPPDSATLAREAAHAAMLHWVESAGRSEQIVTLKNTSQEFIQVESYEIYECINISPSRLCRVHRDGPLIRPGQTIKLVTLGRLRPTQGWSFRYRFQVRFLRDSLPRDTIRP
jgi:hypothetical protein